jgi:hypothetical protein
MKKVKLKSYSELKKLIRLGKVELITSSDSGEYMTVGVKDGGVTHLFGLCVEEFGEYFEVTKLDNHISENQLDRLRILFDD